MSEKILINRLPDVLPDGVQSWPESLPDPLYSGYQFSERDGRVITEMQQGPPRIRRGVVNQPRSFSLNFIFSRDQLNTFIGLYRDDMQSGTLPVSIVVSDERGFAYSYIKIMNQLSYRPVTRSGYFSVTINAIEVGRP